MASVRDRGRVRSPSYGFQPALDDPRVPAVARQPGVPPSQYVVPTGPPADDENIERQGRGATDDIREDLDRGRDGPFPWVGAFRPSITDVAGGGTEIVLTGLRLDMVNEIVFLAAESADNASATITFRSGTLLRFLLPEMPAELVDDGVTGDTVFAPVALMYNQTVEPVVTAVDPWYDNDLAGGIECLLTGTNLDFITGITVDGIYAHGLSLTPTLAGFILPPCPRERANLLLPIGLNFNVADDFTLLLRQFYVGPVPAVTFPNSDFPLAISVEGGDSVDLLGTNLARITRVLVGDSEATDVVATSTSVSFTAPAAEEDVTGPISVGLYIGGSAGVVAENVLTYVA